VHDKSQIFNLLNENRQNIRKFAFSFFILYPITFFIMSPDLLMFGAAERIMAGDIMFFGFLFILSFFAGRLYCGWACPAGALQDFCMDINRKPANNKLNWIKWIQFIPWISFFIFLVVYFSELNMLTFFIREHRVFRW
jgi:polyferredoxin